MKIHCYKITYLDIDNSYSERIVSAYTAEDVMTTFYICNPHVVKKCVVKLETLEDNEKPNQ